MSETVPTPGAHEGRIPILSEPELMSSTPVLARSTGRVRTRARESFESFYEAELPQLVALARALGGPLVADDLAQEAMIAAYRHWARISQYDDPRAWVRRVCVNLATSLLRRRAAEARAVMRLGSRRPAAPVEPQTEAFWDEVRRLPRRQAQATALRYIYDLDIAQVAQIMGCTEGTVKVHLTRARSVLTARLLADEEDS